ncbi:Uncharacterized protein DBV15_09147 [Temnothorax longispinosus]|uniref:Uncharacterized protein n=1 Tax=Temnothorax longispinosus TaxID=300112 RepID=A0A4S2KBI7_9HYME|nr:Uncharacterized protein DBV15_09147 [Temnothorax longispinosus]
MSFNPGVPGYEGENHPCGAMPFRGVVGAAWQFCTGNWIPLPRGSWASAPRAFGSGPRETPFRGLSKNIDNAPWCKGDSHFTYGFPKGLDYASYEVTKREQQFRARSKTLDLLHGEAPMVRTLLRNKNLIFQLDYRSNIDNEPREDI